MITTVTFFLFIGNDNMSATMPDNVTRKLCNFGFGFELHFGPPVESSHGAGVAGDHGDAVDNDWGGGPLGVWVRGAQLVFDPLGQLKVGILMFPRDADDLNPKPQFRGEGDG